MNSLSCHKRHTSSQCVTCDDQSYRHKRHTPLGGVTDVTLVDLVPMAPNETGVGTGGGTSSFSLPKKSGEVV